MTRQAHRSGSRRLRRARRGFNLVEMLIALAITAALLSATMVALDASFMAYQSTTEVASTHTIGRLTMHRVLALIRTGVEFTPVPADPRDTIRESDYLDILTPDGEVVSIEWREADEALYVVVNGQEALLMEGVVAQYDPDTGDRIPPFTLEYELGNVLHRATVDLAIVPDDNMSVEMDGDNQDVIRLVASAMPRLSAYE
ncbi:MAG: prepilin-type N-terminal cleavage/methylation domain-containing protein [Planctomycetota bacterium]|nr:prepilin-type N-terminal cleavage/methylation domain-containing protein [Planctomycetota bacterium]